MGTHLERLEDNIDLVSKGVLSRRPAGGLWRKQSASVLRDFFFELCDDLSIDMLIEVGAHEAETSIQYVNQTGGQAIAFEANPFTFKNLTSSAAAFGVDVRNIGVAGVIGHLDMHIPIPKGSKSLTPGRSSFLKRTEDERSEVVSVEVTTLDAVSAELDPKHAVALWLDVEGLCFQVLSGGLKLLVDEKCQMVFLEVESMQIWEDQSVATDVFGLMADVGFVPVMRDAEFAAQYNVIFVRESQVHHCSFRVSDFWEVLANIRINYLSRAGWELLRTVSRRI